MSSILGEMKNETSKRKVVTYHGWIVVEESGDKFIKDTIWVEFLEPDKTNKGRATSTRRRVQMERHGEFGAVDAVEWWDKRLGKPVKLLPTFKGCLRVYTEEET